LERLRRKNDLDRVFREGRRFSCPWAVLQARGRTAEEQQAAGLRVAVVAARGFPTAVARNRARRLLRESCRVALGEAGGRWDLVLVARREVLSVPFAARVEALSALLREAGVLGEKAAAAV
jgi:ribonuclease P protein component